MVHISRSFKYVQFGRHPKLIELSDAGLVRCNRGQWHGEWTPTTDPDGLLIKWHYDGDDSRARVHKFSALVGTECFRLECTNPDYHATLVPLTGDWRQ